MSGVSSSRPFQFTKGGEVSSRRPKWLNQFPTSPLLHVSPLPVPLPTSQQGRVKTAERGIRAVGSETFTVGVCQWSYRFPVNPFHFCLCSLIPLQKIFKLLERRGYSKNSSPPKKEQESDSEKGSVETDLLLPTALEEEALSQIGASELGGRP